MRRPRAVLTLCALALCAALPASAGAATLVGDYTFEDTLNPAAGSGAPLTHLNPANTFATETVDGASRRVLKFPYGGGVRFTTSAPIPNYSIVLKMRFDQLSSWRRIIDFSNRASDTGLYFYNGRLQFYPYLTGPTAIGANQWVEVALTRDSLGNVRWYVNDNPEGAYNDAGNSQARITNSINFFLDDLAVSGEMSSGAVQRIRIYDGILTATEVGVEVHGSAAQPKRSMTGRTEFTAR